MDMRERYQGKFPALRKGGKGDISGCMCVSVCSVMLVSMKLSTKKVNQPPTNDCKEY